MRPQPELPAWKRFQSILENSTTTLGNSLQQRSAIGQDGCCHWWWSQRYSPGLPKRCYIFLPETKHLHCFNRGLHLKMFSPLRFSNQCFHKNYFSFSKPKHYNDDYTGSYMTEPSLALLLFLFSCISTAAHIHNVLCNCFLVIALTRSPGGRRVTRVNISVAWKGTTDIENCYHHHLYWSCWDTQALPQSSLILTVPTSRMPAIAVALVLAVETPGIWSEGTEMINGIRIRHFAPSIDQNEHLTNSVIYIWTGPERILHTSPLLPVLFLCFIPLCHTSPFSLHLVFPPLLFSSISFLYSKLIWLQLQQETWNIYLLRVWCCST